MAHYVLTASKIILGQYDISGDLNSVRIERSQKDLDDTNFSSAANGFESCIPGLSKGVIGMGGLVELTDDGQDEIFNAQMSLSNTPLTVGYGGLADFARVKFGAIQQGSYQAGGDVGGRAEFSAEGLISNYALVEGNVMATGAKTGTFNGTWRQLGAVSATQKLYAIIHAIAKTSFTSAVFKVQSADDAGGTNTTDRITFTTITDLTSEFAVPISGAITQQFWRVICSAFTGTSLTIYSSVGIQ
jgi:hypothetical protein